MSKIDYSEFPWVSLYDFNSVVIDATYWEDDDFYQAMILFLKDDPENPERCHGMIWEVPICADSLGEIYKRVSCLIHSGLFATLDISDHGTLYDSNGDQVELICWAHEAELLEEDDDTPTVTVTQSTLTVH